MIFYLKCFWIFFQNRTPPVKKVHLGLTEIQFWTTKRTQFCKLDVASCKYVELGLKRNFALALLVVMLTFASIFADYSRLRNKHRGTLINFWTFFQGLRSLLERVMHIFFQNIWYFMLWGMPILRATLNIFSKSSRGYVYSRF